MFILLAVPKIFSASPMTQWTSKGYNIFQKGIIFFEKGIIDFEFNSCRLLVQMTQEKCLILIMGHLCVTSDPMDLNGNTRNI